MALWKFVSEGNLEKVRGILEQSSDEERGRLLKRTFGRTKMTVLHKAIEEGHEDIVELLLKKHADVHLTDHHCRTALHTATSNEKENIRVTKLILNCQGVEVDALDEYGNTPLKLAAEKNHYETVELLISKGANVNQADNVDNTPLHVAAKKGNDQVLELLLAKVDASTVGKQTKEKYTALHYAVESGKERCVALLLKYGAGTCVESENEQGRTPLDLANDHRNQTILELLRDPKRASEYLRKQQPRAPLGKGGSVESDSSVSNQARLRDLEVEVEGLDPQLPASNGAAIRPYLIVKANKVNLHQNFGVNVQSGGMAAIGPGAQMNMTQADSENVPKEQMHIGGAEFNINVKGGNVAAGDNCEINVNTGQSGAPSPAGSSDSPVNFLRDQENRDPYGRCPPETGAPVENSDSQGPSEASLPPLEGFPGGEGRGALSRSFPEETGPDDKSLAQPLQEEFPSEKGSGESFRPIQEESTGDKSNGASPLSVQEVFLPDKKEQSLAQPVQEEFRSNKDSGTLPFPLQEDSPPGKGHQSLPQPVQEEAVGDKDSSTFLLPVQEDSPPGKDHQSLPQPVQEEAVGDKDSSTFLLPVQEDSPPGKGHQSLPQPVQEEAVRDEDSSTSPLPVQEDSPPGKGHQSLPQPVQEEAAKDEDNGTLTLPVQDDSSLVKDHQSLVLPVQEEAPRDKDSGALLVQAQGDSSQSLEVQSGERVFQDGNHQLTEGGRLYRVPLRGGPPPPLPQTTPRNRGGGNASYHNPSENARAESPHRTERHSRDNSPSATIDLGDLDSRPNGVQDENPDDDMGGRRICNCIGM